MSTLRERLTDLRLCPAYWSDLDDDFPPPSVATHVNGQPGFLTRRDVVERRAALGQCSVEHLNFYVAHEYFKFAIINEGFHLHDQMNLTFGDGSDSLGDEIPKLHDLAFESLADRLV